MTSKIISSREFNQDPSGAKRAANEGPVFITDRGKPTHVLMSFEQYRRMTAEPRNIVDLLGMPGDTDFEPPKLDSVSRPADLS